MFATSTTSTSLFIIVVGVTLIYFGRRRNGLAAMHIEEDTEVNGKKTSQNDRCQCD
jgi:hypothetical protein